MTNDFSPAQANTRARRTPPKSAGNRVGHRKPPGKSRQEAKADTLFRETRAVNKALIGMTLVLSLLGWQHLRAWYSVTTRVKERSSLLYGLRKREVDYRRKNGAFAGSLEDLRVTKIPDLPGDIHVVAGRFAGDPGFLVEYCDSFSCVAIDQEGTMRQSMTYVPDHLPEKLPVLEEGPGRFFVSPAPEEGKIQ